MRSNGQKTILKKEWLLFILRFTFLLPFYNHYLSLPPPPMASIQFIQLLSSSIGSSIESRQGRPTVIILVRILMALSFW